MSLVWSPLRAALLLVVWLHAARALSQTPAPAAQAAPPPTEQAKGADAGPASTPRIPQPTAAVPPEVERRMLIFADELQRLRESLVLPEKETYKSVFGLGPAASKIYLQKSGLSIGGYAEFFVERQVKDKQPGKDFLTGDLARYVQYVGYKFSDRILMNVEVEMEHAGLPGPNFQGQSGEVSVEFAYLDFLTHAAANVRLGLMLMPMGFINEIHEPPFFHGALRPAVETLIIPTTWRALGAGLFGELLPGLTYKLFTVVGLNAQDFAPSGWSAGRQNGNRVLAEDWGVVGRVDYQRGDLLMVGASAFYSRADQQRFGGVAMGTLLAEGHAQLRWRGLELRLLGAYGSLGGARTLTLSLFPDTGNPAFPEQRVIASDLYGWYAEVAYDLWPRLSRSNRYLAPYVRFERLNTQFRTPTIAGRSADPSLDQSIIEAGLTFKPHPQVVLKVNYRDTSSVAGTPVADGLFFGAGFIY